MKRFGAHDLSTLIMYRGAKEVGRVHGVTDSRAIQALLDNGL